MLSSLEADCTYESNLKIKHPYISGYILTLFTPKKNDPSMRLSDIYVGFTSITGLLSGHLILADFVSTTAAPKTMFVREGKKTTIFL